LQTAWKETNTTRWTGIGGHRTASPLPNESPEPRVEPLHGDREDGRCTVTGKTVAAR
jgi:hypothetical protein